MMRSAIIAGIIFVIAHFAMLVGITTPEKFYFDEVHYVPAARQMLEPVMPQPMLNPMHPPLAKQLIALSIHSFGDVPLGWRYPAVLFGALAIVAVYLCGLALFAAQGPAIAASLARLLQPDAVRAIADRDAGYFCARPSACSPSRRSCTAFGKRRPHLWFALDRVCLRSVDRLQMERAVRARGLHRHRGGDPPDAKLAHAICRRQ